ncbi:hypothetical protein [Nonomuraea salmonea]|uniref:CPXCG motif-containing cysteine-rich protein n=1 Tax=Nonomuraea salmonea TaxID=46181 RepID=A0ABV5P2T0_9ACTN
MDEPMCLVYCGHCGADMIVPARVFDPDRDLSEVYRQECGGCHRNVQVNG